MVGSAAYTLHPACTLSGLRACALHNAAAAAVCDQAEWSLDTVLSLPWRPRVSILGSTIYTLNADANQVRALYCRTL
jgi:hypothetical protein